MAWKIEFADSVLKQLKKLDKNVARQIIDYLETKVAPLDDPTSIGKALSGPLATFWRFRVGDYRIICHIDNSLVTVVVLRIAHRSKVYKDEKKIASKAGQDVEEFEARKKTEGQQVDER